MFSLNTASPQKVVGKPFARLCVLKTFEVLVEQGAGIGISDRLK